MDGKVVHMGNPRDAAALGIETVYQDLALAPDLDAAANVFLGRELRRIRILHDQAEMRRQTAARFKELGVGLVQDLRVPVASFSGGQRQSVAIARAAMWAQHVIIMDEPTAALGVIQTAKVLDLIRDRPGPGARRRADLAQPPRGPRGVRPDRGHAPRRPGRPLPTWRGRRRPTDRVDLRCLRQRGCGMTGKGKCRARRRARRPRRRPTSRPTSSPGPPGCASWATTPILITLVFLLVAHGGLLADGTGQVRHRQQPVAARPERGDPDRRQHRHHLRHRDRAASTCRSPAGSSWARCSPPRRSAIPVAGGGYAIDIAGQRHDGVDHPRRAGRVADRRPAHRRR